jgi:hypothetical protein
MEVHSFQPLSEGLQMMDLKNKWSIISVALMIVIMILITCDSSWLKLLLKECVEQI